MNKGLLINTSILEDREFITIEDLAKALKVSHYTIYRISNRGELKPYKFMRRNYWRTDEVKSYLINLGVLRDTNTINKQMEINETTI